MIQVIHRALDILEYVAFEPEKPKLLGEIADDFKLKPSTCANIVKTLVERGYLKKCENQKGYLIGNHIALLNDKNGYKNRLIAASNKELDFLTNKLEENSLIAILNGENRIVVNKRNAKQVVQAQTDDEKNAYDSSTGRLLIAMLNDNEIKNYINKHGLPDIKVWPDVKCEKDLFLQLNKIKNEGYALLEDTVQIIGFAAPIYYNAKVIASLSIYMPAFRYTNELRKLFIELGLAASKNISKNLESL